MHYGWMIAFLVPLLAACGESEPVEPGEPAPDGAVEAGEMPAPVVIPAEIRSRIVALDGATSTGEKEQASAWEAYDSLRGAGEGTLAAVMKVPGADRPLKSMLEAWMRSEHRTALGLTALGDELAFRQEVESPERRARMVFRLERAAEEGRSSVTIEVTGRGTVAILRDLDGTGSTESGKIGTKELDAFFALLLENKFWLQQGIRQQGSKDEALVTLTQLREEDTLLVPVRSIEVWENEATTFNRSLGKIVAGLRAWAESVKK